MPRDPERITLQTYTNKKGEQRIGMQFAYSLGLKIATGNREAIDKLIDAITARVEREETKTEDE